jgi:hypothetical protein
MKNRTIKINILSGIFIITAFLVVGKYIVSAEGSSPKMAYSKGACIFSHISEKSVEGELRIHGAVFQNSFMCSDLFCFPDTSCCKVNFVDAISASKGSFLIALFKKLRRILSGISRFF